MSTWADLAAAHLAVTIEDVARHAEIGKGTVYLHWKTREALFGAVFEREVLAAIEELVAGLREDPEAWLPHRLARSYFLAIVGRPLLRGLFLDDAQLLGKLARPGGGGCETRHRAISHDYFDLMTEHGVVHRPGGREDHGRGAEARRRAHSLQHRGQGLNDEGGYTYTPPGAAGRSLTLCCVSSPDQSDVEFSARPQSLMLTFFAVHILDTARAVSSGSVIDVFGRAGITEDAVRTTLTRMVNRGLLERHRRGRKMYFGLTARAQGVLHDGRDRVWRTGAVNRDWDGSWTIVGFSLPEDWRRERHDLRSRLVWGGFGPLQNGMWTAPGRLDVSSLLAGLGLEGYLKVFHAQTAKPTEAAAVVETAFDLAGIAGRYRAFQARWERAEPAAEAADDLARELLLHTDWLGLVRQDPHLPAEHLPGGWPAVAAEALFHTLAERYAAPAREIAAGILDTIELTDDAPAE